jgi:hypothetical protein
MAGTRIWWISAGGGRAVLVPSPYAYQKASWLVPAIEDRRFALAHHMARPPHRQARVGVHDVTRHQPVEQVTDGGEAQFCGRDGVSELRLLDPRGDVDAECPPGARSSDHSHRARNSRAARR